MALCMCGHEQHEHWSKEYGDRAGSCSRCWDECRSYTPRPDYARTTSFLDADAPRSTTSYSDLPVSQGARDLMERVAGPNPGDGPRPAGGSSVLHTLDILAAADPKDVTNLLWARRVGKL